MSGHRNALSLSEAVLGTTREKERLEVDVGSGKQGENARESDQYPQSKSVPTGSKVLTEK
jgi:hypothetical protein